MEQDFPRFSIARPMENRRRDFYLSYNVDRYRMPWNIGCNYTAQMFTRYVMRGWNKYVDLRSWTVIIRD